MSHYTALLDANVLYPAPLRDLFLATGGPQSASATLADPPIIYCLWLGIVVVSQKTRCTGKMCYFVDQDHCTSFVGPPEFQTQLFGQN